MDPKRQDDLYTNAVALFGPALARLARGYEADSDRCRDLLQDVHFALWRSFAVFDGQCSLRTWVYRVAHNVSISGRLRRRHLRLASLEELADTPAPDNPEVTVHSRQAVARLHGLIRQLRPPDRQVMLLYLEEIDAGAIGEITGLSPGAVATRIHRIKALLVRNFRQGSTP